MSVSLNDVNSTKTLSKELTHSNTERAFTSKNQESTLESLSADNTSSADGCCSSIRSFVSTIGDIAVWPFVKIYEGIASVIRMIFCCFYKSSSNIFDRIISDPVAVLKETEQNPTKIAEEFVDLIVTDPKAAEVSFINLYKSLDAIFAACKEYFENVAKENRLTSSDEDHKVVVANTLVNLILAESPLGEDKELIRLVTLWLLGGSFDIDENRAQLTEEKGSERTAQVTKAYEYVAKALDGITDKDGIINRVYDKCLFSICGPFVKEIFTSDLLDGFQKDGFYYFHDESNFNKLQANLNEFITNIEKSKEEHLNLELLKFVQAHLTELMADPLEFAKSSVGERLQNVAVEVFKEIIVEHKNKEEFASSPFIKRLFEKVENAFEDKSKAKEIVFFFLNVCRAIDEAAGE